MTPMVKELENPQRLTGFNWKIDQKPPDAVWLMNTWNEDRKTAVKKLWPTLSYEENKQVLEEPVAVPLEPITDVPQDEKIESQPNATDHENK